MHSFLRTLEKALEYRKRGLSKFAVDGPARRIADLEEARAETVPAPTAINERVVFECLE
jgi:hypothetical protein